MAHWSQLADKLKTNQPREQRTEQGDTDRGTVTEDGDSDDKVDTVQSVSGKLDIIDADKGEAVFQVQSNVEDGNYGRFSIDADRDTVHGHDGHRHAKRRWQRDATGWYVRRRSPSGIEHQQPNRV
ncbi:hypothetical protein FC652_20720 [Vibrio sp. 05-20-BW147]|nr:hypothetical protein [Vibrio sp. 05-20-BW147]